MYKTIIAAAVFMAVASLAQAQSPASSFERGSSRQVWQDRGCPR